MIRLEKTEVLGWEHAIRGMRNPMNSWEKSDSQYCGGQKLEDCEKWQTCHMDYCVGENDLDLMTRLRNAGPDERKFMRQIFVSVDITAPLYWWKEFDTYKVGTVANSCSTMHKIHAKEFTLDDFSHEHMDGETMPLWHNGDGSTYNCSSYDFLCITCCVLNLYRNKFLETKDKKWWWQLIQHLPTSYNQLRTVTLNYEVLANMYAARKSHKLDEWHDLCHWIEGLPYSQLITGN